MTLTVLRAPVIAVRVGIAALLAVVLGGCSVSQVFGDMTRIDYKASSQGRPLEVPPDLITPRGDDRYAIPQRPTSGTTFSAYTRDKATEAANPVAQPGVLTQPPGVRIEREGDRRWLVIDQPPDRVWPVVRDFWSGTGFTLVKDSPETGILETDWAVSRPPVPDSFIRGTLSRALGTLYTAGTRDKFRTRLEPVNNGTEVYVTHRGMTEELTGALKDSSFWVMSPPNPDLEAEFLRRLMLRFTPQNQAAVAQAAAAVAAPAAQVAARATLVDQGGRSYVRLQDGFDRAWRQVGLVLDRSGFTVEDRDRSKGTFFVRYVDPEQPGQKQGLIDRIVGTPPKKDLSGRRYRLVVTDDSPGSRVTVLGEDGLPPTTDADLRIANQIAGVLRDQLL
jgi:outer membrane protein assembly factor BamC